MSADATRDSYLVPAVETRSHILFLRSSGGLTCAGIAKLAQLSPTTVTKCYLGQARYLRRATADAILGVGLADVRDDLRVKAQRVQELLDAMGEAGITQREIAAMLGMEADELSLARNPTVYGRTLRRVTTLYQALNRHGRVPAHPLLTGPVFGKSTGHLQELPAGPLSRA